MTGVWYCLAVIINLLSLYFYFDKYFYSVNNIKLIILLYFKRNKPPLISVALESRSPLLESVKNILLEYFYHLINWDYLLFS